MERLNWNLAIQLAQRAPLAIVAPIGAGAHSNPQRSVVLEVPLRPLWKFLAAVAWNGLCLARSMRPQWVLAGSGLTAPMAWVAARLSGARCAAYVHGLDLAVEHPLYRIAWFSALRRMDRVIANSRASAELAIGLGVPAESLRIVHPGVDVSARDVSARARFRHRHGLGEAPILLSVGRLSERKGLREFVADVLPLIARAHPSVRFVVVGDVPADALHARAQTIESIEKAAQAAGVGHCLLMLGRRFGDELLDAYAAADLHVFPVRQISGDPEGFGMVAIEAAAQGVATVAYATGGVVDAIEHGVSGILVPVGDAQAFAAAVERLLQSPLDVAGMREFARGFAWDQFGRRTWAALQDAKSDD
jgi:phosphatidylinositol alpha-1,6-mannosyltransferase